jgi:bifunctional enzyme CysN/CysC
MLPSTGSLFRFSTAGSVDDGKSTLIGRLLYETNCVYLDHISEAKGATRNASIADAGEEIDFALLCDGLKAEREQGITIDVAYRYFETPKRKFVIADTPGHEQYTRNMATGASTANLALILVDARKGLLPQSKRHAFISSLLGVRHVIVCVNKMDLVDYSQEAYDKICASFSDFAARLRIADLRFIPVSALKGDNIVRRSERMPWHSGAPLLQMLETVHGEADRNLVDLRFPVQTVLRPDQDFRGFAGTVASGVVKPGDEVLILPSRKTSRVSRVVTFDGDLKQAFPPQAVTLVLEDEVDVSRGDMIVHPRNQPRVARRLEAMLVWMDETPLELGKDYLIKHTTQSVRGRVEALSYLVDVTTLSRRIDKGSMGLNEIGRVTLSTHQPLYFDAYERNRATGRLILIDPQTHATVGAGMIIDRVPAGALATQAADWHEEDDESREGQGLPERVGADERAEHLGHRPATVWLTGLPACGGTEIAYALERLLAKRRVLSYVLGGRELRTTLSHDLDHSARDTSEHLRRVSAVARILNQAGTLAICSFVSPTLAVRARVRETLKDDLIVVHVASPLEWCESRDPRSVYARARAGELLNVAGVNAPYEHPESPELVLRPDQTGIEAAAEAIVSLLEARGLLSADGGQ